MKITKLERFDYNYAILYVDGEKYAKIPLETALTYRLKSDLELSSEMLELILRNSEQSKVKIESLKLLSVKMYSVNDFKNKLLSKGYEEEMVDIEIERLKKINLLNDENYCNVYVSSSFNDKKNGPRKIEYELYLKGIDSHIVKEHIEFICTYEKQITNCLDILSRKALKNCEDINKYKSKQLRYLASKGYSYEISKDALEVYLDGK